MVEVEIGSTQRYFEKIPNILNLSKLIPYNNNDEEAWVASPKDYQDHKKEHFTKNLSKAERNNGRYLKMFKFGRPKTKYDLVRNSRKQKRNEAKLQKKISKELEAATKLEASDVFYVSTRSKEKRFSKSALSSTGTRVK